MVSFTQAFQLRQEPQTLLSKRQRQRGAAWHSLDRRQRLIGSPQLLRQRQQRRVGEQGLQRQLPFHLLQTVGQTHRQQRVAPVQRSYRGDLPAPRSAARARSRQQRFVFTLRRFIRRLALRPCGSGNARRSSLPFGDSGNAATTTQADGTI